LRLWLHRAIPLQGVSLSSRSQLSEANLNPVLAFRPRSRSLTFQYSVPFFHRDFNGPKVQVRPAKRERKTQLQWTLRRATLLHGPKISPMRSVRQRSTDRTYYLISVPGLKNGMWKSGVRTMFVTEHVAIVFFRCVTVTSLCLCFGSRRRPPRRADCRLKRRRTVVKTSGPRDTGPTIRCPSWTWSSTLTSSSARTHPNRKCPPRPRSMMDKRTTANNSPKMHTPSDFKYFLYQF
jgi:hypothetical protein